MKHLLSLMLFLTVCWGTQEKHCGKMKGQVKIKDGFGELRLYYIVESMGTDWYVDAADIEKVEDKK